MKNEKHTTGAETVTRDKSKRLIIIFVSVFIATVLLFGIVLGTVSIIKSSRSAMSYKGVSVTLPVASYLSSIAKYNFMAHLAATGINAEDTVEFWNSSPEGEGVTYKDMLKAGTEEYIKRVLLGNYLFDKNTAYAKADKETVKRTVGEILDYKANNSKQYFNELAEPMGFAWKDFEKAAEMIYKYQMSESVIFGYDGASLASGNFSDECNEFFETYTRVKLLFIRTEDHYVVNEENGKEELVDYTESEKAEVLNKISEIDGLINSTDGVKMSEGSFDSYILKESSDSMNVAGGYYLAPTSRHTANLSAVYPDVVSTALTMDIGEYRRVDTEWGVCFIYRCESEPLAYAKGTSSAFFTDFYSDAATYIYDKEITKYLADVKVNGKFETIDVVTLPYNYDLVLNFK